MRTPRTLAGRKAKVALLLATVAVAFTAATCASTGTRARQTATPTILSVPSPATALAAATFVYTAGRTEVSYTCHLDGGPSTPCGAGTSDSNGSMTYIGLAAGAHVFEVTAKAEGRPMSAPAKWSGSWEAACTATRGCRAATAPDGRSTAEAVPRRTFSVSGGLAGVMAPGVTQPLDLFLTNANDFAIEVSSIAVTVQDATTTATKDGKLNRACVGSEHMSVSRPFTGPVVVPANATRSLSQLDMPAEQWPQISMLNLTTNQDACKDTTFELTYAGTATR
jgi:hypothetical protein